MSLRAEVFRDLAELGRRADVAALDGASIDMFQTLAWFGNLDQHGRPADMRAACVVLPDAQGSARLCLPLATRHDSQAPLFGPSVGALTTYYSSLFGPVGAAEGCSVDDCRAALKALRGLGWAADVLDLQPLDKDSAFFRHMLEALRAEGYIVDTYFCFGNWHLPCAGLDFAQYYASLASRVRNTVQRHRKKLDKNGPWSIEVLREPGPRLDEAIAQFNQVYSKSWKVPEPFPEFVPGLCRTAAREGWLRLGVLKIGDAPAASQLWLVRDGKALIYKLAYDEAFSQFSPGSVLSTELFRIALDEEKVVDIDYLTGDDGYKRDWMRERRERMGIVAFRRTSVRGLLSATRHGLGRWLRARRQAAAPAAAEAPPPAIADA